MPVQKYLVSLTPAQRHELTRMIRTEKASARKILRAHALLLLDEGQLPSAIAPALHISVATVYRIRQRFGERELAHAIEEQPRPGQPVKLSGKAQAHLTALACSGPPAGHDRWTLRLLADKAIDLGLAESLSHETVRQVLKKTNSSPI